MGVRVLLVADDRLSRIFLKRLVRTFQPGWECLEAVNAEDAWLVLQIVQAQIAIINSRFPGQDGLELARALRREFPEMPIGIVCAEERLELIAAAGAARADVLRQPFDERQLRTFLSDATLDA
jgi:DNA-binding response OmpR family regulator